MLRRRSGDDDVHGGVVEVLGAEGAVQAARDRDDPGVERLDRPQDRHAGRVLGRDERETDECGPLPLEPGAHELHRGGGRRVQVVDALHLAEGDLVAAAHRGGQGQEPERRADEPAVDEALRVLRRVVEDGVVRRTRRVDEEDLHAATRSTSRRAAARRSRRSTTASTSPISRASSASTKRPESTRSTARPRPTSGGRRTVPPQPGMRSNDVSGSAKTAFAAATRQRQASASSRPLPRQQPPTAATVGYGSSAIAWKLEVASKSAVRGERRLRAGQTRLQRVDVGPGREVTARAVDHEPPDRQACERPDQRGEGVEKILVHLVARRGVENETGDPAVRVDDEPGGSLTPHAPPP